ncbi:MAG TPA: hypothetical protein VHN10_07975 [Candidatus Acidoferrales bacterium]|nr:hypothetical protein [Candidatus Acidoferrales bacterium]
MTLRVLLKWTVLIFLVLESLPLIGSLLVLASKVGHWNATFNRVSWGQLALELTLRFAIMGSILSAYLRLENLSQLPLAITRQSALLATGIAQSILLAIITLYALVAERITGRAALTPLLSAWSLSILALGTVIAGLILRKRLLYLANEELRRDPHDANGLSRWRRVTILSMILAASIGTYGFILRVRGDARSLAWPFFFASAALLFLWRSPLDDETSSGANRFSNENDIKP